MFLSPRHCSAYTASVIIIIIIIIVTYKQRSLKKNSDALQAYVIQCCRTGVPSGVEQKLPSAVSKDAGRLVGCSKCLDRKQQSSCDRWLWMSVAHSVCRRQPTSDADVQQAQRPVGRAQPDTGVLVPRRHCVITCIVQTTQRTNKYRICASLISTDDRRSVVSGCKCHEMDPIPVGCGD